MTRRLVAAKGIKVFLRTTLLTVSILSACTAPPPRPQALRSLPFSFELSESAELLTVNGRAADVSEFQQVSRMERSAVTDYYARTYGAAIEGTDWTRSFDGDVPLERLRRRTLIKTVELKVLQDLAENLGVRQDNSWESLIRRWEVENMVRKESIEQGNEVYGPAQYTLDQFFLQDLRSLRLAIMQILEEKDLLREYERSWLTGGGKSSRHERMDQAFRALLTDKIASAKVTLNQAALQGIALREQEGAAHSPQPVNPESPET